jgi:integrase
MPLHRLSALDLKTKKAGRHADGGGLYLSVSLHPTTKEPRRSWLFRYQRDSVEKFMGLGSLDDVSLAEARERATAARKLHRDGEDPKAIRNAARLAKRVEAAKAMTFEQCARAYIDGHSSGWRNAQHLNQWNTSLSTYVLPILGPLPVSQVDEALVMNVLRQPLLDKKKQPFWTSKPETARRVRSRIESILDWATASKFRSGDNPARWKGHLKILLPRQTEKKKHLEAMPYIQVASFITGLGNDVPALALEFTILTAARTGEVRGARWTEVDFESKVWTIPAERTKRQREHRVPLAPRALEILKGLPRTGGRIFPLGQNGMLDKTPEGVTVHGFRSSFRTWCSEQTNFPREVAEAALGHATGDQTERAYQRGDVLEKRRKLMEAWANYCSRPVPDSRVLTFKR